MTFQLLYNTDNMIWSNLENINLIENVNKKCKSNITECVASIISITNSIGLGFTHSLPIWQTDNMFSSTVGLIVTCFNSVRQCS